MRRFTRSALLSIAMLAASPAFATDHFEFDKSHTHILFYVNHLGFSDMIGDFTSYNGTFQFDRKHPESSAVDVTLRPDGIRTSSTLLDEHLQGKDFFNSKTYPDIHFVSRSIKVTGSNTGQITGDLTLLGVTKPVTLSVTFNKADYHPFTKLFVAGFSGETTIKRSDFGMTNLIPLVSDTVRITFQVEGVDMDRKKAEALKH